MDTIDRKNLSEKRKGLLLKESTLNQYHAEERIRGLEGKQLCSNRRKISNWWRET